MVYRYKDYERSHLINFGSVKKNIAYKRLIKSIFVSLNSRTYLNFNEFYASNKTLNMFIRNYLKLYDNCSDITLEHFKNGLGEDDYQAIIRDIAKFINPNLNQNKDTTLYSLRDLISRIDEFDNEDREFIRETLDYVDDIDNVKVDMANKNVYDENGNGISQSKSKTFQKTLTSQAGGSHFYSNIDE